MKKLLLSGICAVICFLYFILRGSTSHQQQDVVTGAAEDAITTNDARHSAESALDIVKNTSRPEGGKDRSRSSGAANSDLGQRVRELAIFLGYTGDFDVLENVAYKDGNRGSLVSVNEIKTSNLYMQFDSETLDLLRFNCTERENVPPGLRKDDGISEKEVRRIAAEVFERFITTRKLPSVASFSIREESIEYASGSDREEGDLYDASWNVSGSYYHAGIRMMCSAFVRISAYSGKVVEFFDFPYVPPKSCQIQISQAQAVRSAELFLADLKVPFGSVTSVEQFYAFPTDFWRALDGSSHITEKQPQLVWRIELTSEMRELVRVEVDVENGKIIGGIMFM